MLEIRVLGTLQVVLDGRLLPVGHGRRVPEVLGWLALHAGLHPRGQIAAAFWPEVPDAIARNNLRQIVWDLRRALETGAAHLAGDRQQLGFLPGPDLSVDAWEFDAHAAAGRWERAAALSTGEVLAGLDADWLVEERERHRRALLEVLRRFGATQHDDASAAAVARRLLELDPYDEGALRLLVQRLEAAGRRAEAVAAGEAFAARLITELGISPAVATAELLDRLRRSPAPPDRAPARVPRAVLPRAAGGFVARTAELAELSRLLRRSRVEGRLVAGVEGDAGIGKTVLAAEFAARAAAAGALVLAGRATEDQLTAYQPWVEALGNHVQTRGPDALRAELPPGARHLLPMLPELTGVVAARREGPGPPDRFRMFQAVADWLHLLATQRPVVVVIDDLHAADVASLELLRHIAAAPADVPLLMVFTCRPRAETTSTQFAATLAECGRHGLSWLRLRGLPQDDLSALVAATTGTPPSADFARALHHRTGGNPFFAGEIVRSLADAEALRVCDGAWAWPSSAAAAVPEGVRHVLENRLARVPAETLRALEVASILGMGFDDAVVGTVLGVPRADVLDGLDAALRAGLLAEPGPGQYAFAHPLVRDVLYSGLTGTRRARIHEGAAQALADVGAPSSVITRHLLDAGTVAATAMAAGHAVHAATGLLEQGAWEEARALTDRVLAHEGLTPPVRRRLLSLRGLTLVAEWQLVAENRAVNYLSVAPEERSKNAPGAPSGGTSDGATSPASS